MPLAPASPSMDATPETVLAQPQTGDRAVAAAWADREARLAADAATMAAGPTEHMAGLLDHHQGLPTVQTQMVTHGAAPPHVPDTGGHDSASAPIG